MVDTIQAYGRIDPEDVEGLKIVPNFKKGDDLAVLINNLGGASNFEMHILTMSVVKFLEGTHGCKCSRVFVGSYMTSFEMQVLMSELFSDVKIDGTIRIECKV